MTDSPSFRPPKDLPTSGAPGGQALDSKKPSTGCGAGCLIVVGVFVLIAVIFGLASCGSGSESSDMPEATSKYTQTWPQIYSETTCADWLNELTAGQQFAASADMLAGARNKGDGGTGLPPDSMIDEFSSGISNVCVESTMAITDAAVGLYLTEPRFHP
jgi:hypothetical protein